MTVEVLEAAGLGSALLLLSPVGLVEAWATGSLFCLPPHASLWSRNPHYSAWHQQGLTKQQSLLGPRWGTIFSGTLCLPNLCCHHHSRSRETQGPHSLAQDPFPREADVGEHGQGRER